MSKEINYKNKYILNNKQIDVLYTTHQKIIREGLIQMGVSKEYHGPFLDAAAITFETLIKEAQAKLNKIVEMSEIKREILKDE